jgi:hypothetical protein
MDFSLSSSRRSSINDISIKPEPMDYDGFTNHSKESLNTFGPQGVTFHPEASANSSDNR